MDLYEGMPADIRQYITGGRPPQFPAAIPTPPPYRNHLTQNVSFLPTHQVTDTMSLRGIGGIHHNFQSDCAATAVGFEVEPVICGFGGGDPGAGRWPRQETLTLLEIRSRLDARFREANQKGPLWDEVSRIMAEEHGYHRNGKKCREKFENLYKYYKKTKDGKACRQDGKHYRFFRQLEALYGGGESSTNHHQHLQSQIHTSNPKTQETTFQIPKQLSNHSLSLSNSSEYFDTSSCYDDDDEDVEKKKKRRGSSWKGQIKSFIDSQMKKLMDKQEEWLEKMMSTIEKKEQERMMKDEEWRRQEVARVEREREFWTRERAWIEARDASLMEVLHKLAEGGNNNMKASSSSSPRHEQSLLGRDITSLFNQQSQQSWSESEVLRLIHLRTEMDTRFGQLLADCCNEDVLWEEIAANMSYMGCDQRNRQMCKEKWESISHYIKKPKN
ncbi:trihelix transcription factor PTL-like [Impatiens glandulifera]|uniref:trihelix transcription factor PTL-like n=1 Tax=Impatiens glandulifera TaxID=253017 RepID=UPI001FB11B57|nr:trihelix transcription factor PTL-like [Impatiens glandulifera]